MKLTRHTQATDPAFTSAVICGFVSVPDAPGFHESYFAWCEANDRPYVSAWTIPFPGVLVNMNTCSWVLDLRSRDRAKLLLMAPENRGGYVHVDPRMVEAGEMDAGQVRTLAFRLMEISQDARPPEPAP